jgi:hypothetical protein
VGALDSGDPPFIGDSWAVIVDRGTRPRRPQSLVAPGAGTAIHSRGWDVDLDYRWRGEATDL